MINIAIDPKLEGGRAPCREPSVRIRVVEGGGSACSIDGVASSSSVMLVWMVERGCEEGQRDETRFSSR